MVLAAADDSEVALSQAREARSATDVHVGVRSRSTAGTCRLSPDWNRKGEDAHADQIGAVTVNASTTATAGSSPSQFAHGASVESLELSGEEAFDVLGLD